MSRHRERRARQQPPGTHLNLNVRGMGASATVAIDARADALRARGAEIVKLGLGQSPFPVPEPVVATLRAHAHEKDYLPTAGLPALRDAIAAYTRRACGIERRGEDVLVGPGSKELMFLLQLVYYGDLVVPSPSWVSYAPQARIVGRRVRWVETSGASGWHLHPEQLEALCAEDPGRPRIFVLNYPGNPTGTTYRLEELRALADVARRHKVVLLSDEIYGELHHMGQHVSVARFYPEGTIVSSGLSKWCGAGGWRLGYFVFPPTLHWLREAMTAAASETYTSTSAPIQYAAVRAFEGGETLETYLRRSRRVLGALGRWAARTLRSSGADCPAPDGAFYLFPDFSPLRERLARRGIATSRDLAEAILEQLGIALLPGVVFGRPAEELTLRIAYVDFDGAAALEAAAGLDGSRLDEAFLRRIAPRVVDAVERLAGWVAG